MSFTISIGPLIIPKNLLFTIISLICSMLWLHWNIDEKKMIKKQLQDEFFNLFFYYLVALFIAKFIFLGKKFLFTSPLSIVSFPANKQMFYVALIFLLIYVLIQTKFNKINIKLILPNLFQILLVGQFVYSFLMYIFLDANTHFIPMLFFAILLSVLQFNHLKQTFNLNPFFIYIGWLIVNLLFNFQQNFPFFLYYVDYLFWIIILIFSLILFSIMNKKEKILK